VKIVALLMLPAQDEVDEPTFFENSLVVSLVFLVFFKMRLITYSICTRCALEIIFLSFLRHNFEHYYSSVNTKLPGCFVFQRDSAKKVGSVLV